MCQVINRPPPLNTRILSFQHGEDLHRTGVFEQIKDMIRMAYIRSQTDFKYFIPKSTSKRTTLERKTSLPTSDISGL
jgi:hypothetical protein